MRWSRLVLLLLLLVDVWYRAHTFGPYVRDALGTNLWPSTIGSSEPLDCDEAAYAYIGHRVTHGAVLYRDVTENKTPLGYWLYALAVLVGGYNELAIRILPIPFVLLTITLVWWIAGRLGGQVSACLAAGLYVLLSTDPFLFGNGSNLEHFVNLFSTALLAFLILAWDHPRRWPLFAAGASLAAAALVKQFAILPIVIVVPALLLRARQGRLPGTRGLKDDDSQRSSPRTISPPLEGGARGNAFRQAMSRIARAARPTPRTISPPLEGGARGGASPQAMSRTARAITDVMVFTFGAFSIAALAASVLLAQGAGRDAVDDIFFYGRALATDTLPEPGAPPALYRWITGNADPQGRLPWPFGTTNYLVWWGTASWPLWLASIPSIAFLLFAAGTTAPRRLSACWSIAAWAQVALPGLYWQHYYLLPIAGAAIAVAVCIADAIQRVSQMFRRASKNDWRTTSLALVSVPLLLLAMAATAYLEVRDYLLVEPEQLTIQYKGGGQWVVLRNMGRDLRRRGRLWNNPHLYIWGWQSPLLFYGRMDSPTRHFFVDNLLRDQADRDHRLIRPRTEEIIATLKRHPPELIFTGYPPFRALQECLNDRYFASSLAPGLWVRREDFGRFEAAGATPE